MPTESCCDLSSQNIDKIPEFLLTETGITSLNLNFNEVTEIPNVLCSNFQRLTVLFLNGNELEVLPSNIGDLISLKKLFLNENLLTCLPKSIGELKNLEVFHVMGNSLSCLPDEFTQLKNLTDLFINENSIATLPASIGSLEKLTNFDASYNQINVIPESFGNLHCLRNLNFSCNCIAKLPDSFQYLPEIRTIDLSHNCLEILCENFASSEVVNTLFVECNNLYILPSWFGDMKCIKEISLEGNKLQGMPFPLNFGSVSTELEYLNLSGNYIFDLPETFSNLKKLKFLDLGSPLEELERRRNLSNGNFMTCLPHNFPCLSSLSELYLDENELTELPGDFGSLKSLSLLDLSHNYIQLLPASFCSLPSLKVCLLSVNFIEALPDDIGNLSSLEELRLDNNLLVDLPDSFEKLTGLHTLDLYNNNLKAVPKALNVMSLLKKLDLRENDFGIPVTEIPEICPKVAYASPNPELKDNWRGRKRDDVIEECYQNGVVSAASNVIPDVNGVITSAFYGGSSLWRKHGETEDRKPALYEESSLVDSENVKNELNESTNITEEINNNTCDNVNDTEYWDTELCDRSSTDSSSKDDLVNSFINDWESESEDCQTKYASKSDVYMENNHFFLPSDIHPPLICREQLWSDVESGQFDDADSDS